MWSAQYVLAQGCGWHNGNGSSINIWQDQWLKNDDNLKLITSTIEGLENPILGSLNFFMTSFFLEMFLPLLRLQS